MLIAIFSQGVKSHTKCKLYPHSPKDCIQKTQNIGCTYDSFYNKCEETQDTNSGCSPLLNREACLIQLTDDQNNKVQCIFQDRCMTANKNQQEQYGCSEMFNKYACLTVEKQFCIWEDNRCKKQIEKIQNNSRLCNIFSTPVTPYTCSSLPNGQLDLREISNLSYFSCNELGLNEESCLTINKENQYCTFEDNKCIEIQLMDIRSCDQKLSQFACLQIINKDLQCEWVGQKCRKYQRNNNDDDEDCETQNQVNVSVCQISTGLCYYDKIQHKCLNIDTNNMNMIKCDTPGLSKLACLSIKNQKCSFVKQKCQELSEEDLNLYQCHMELNQLACVNIKTHFQYCFWNGDNCERRVINQDFDCPLKLDNNNIRVNGNVCQGISKDKVKCKYNEQTNLCVESIDTDGCNAPFINKNGCLNIIANEETCQWTTQGCKYVYVILYETTCASLGSANPIACSQVLEKDEKVGCYFDEIQQQCVTLTVEIAQNATKKEILQHQKDLELLQNINCKQRKQGLNRIACSCITTRKVACRWNRDQCVQINNRKEIQTIECLHLKYANYKACSYVQYGGEICRYNKKIYGCINSFVKNMGCDELGLNSFGCQQAQGDCQFINDQCQKSQDFIQDEDYQIDDTDLFNPSLPPTDIPLTCVSTSPSKSVCVSLSSIQLLCSWNKSKTACESVEIKQNQKCLDFNGIDISVNSNVCASILNDFPDYDFLKGIQFERNRGYCYYNRLTFQCLIKKELCNTKCCTETENIGMNAHACSKFSSNEPGDYCFFMNLRCQELTDDIVDLSNREQIKQFYDENQLPCSSMNKNSCDMIGWSIDQLCYHNGIACLNINYSYYKDYRIFIKEPSVLNENACFAIDGILTEQNTLKYIGYDYENRRCKEIIYNDNEFPYASCEDVKGNRNVCQRYTGNNYCKWDQSQLKCVTIPFDEIDEIITCDFELNIKACTDIKKSSCLFSFSLDRCINVNDFNVDCNHFDSLGKVSWQVCLQIDKSDQQCEFRDYSCVISTKESDACDGSLANNRSCFKNTKGLCRWDPNSFQCYVNYTDISQLKCTDSINRELCKKLTHQACIWNDQSNECQEFNTMISSEFDLLSQTGDHKFNQLACLIITGDAYYYDTTLEKCVKLISKTANCNDFQMNKYACLYHTRTHHCFYDEQEIIPNNKCKTFIEGQSICETQWLINIEVCMDIYSPCIFDLNTLLCKTFPFELTMTCTDLQNISINQQHPNKRVCTSVSETLEQTSGELQCFEDKLNQQQCKFEKYCFWTNYSCQIFKLVYDYSQSASGQQQTLKECPDFQEIDTCSNDIVQNKDLAYRKDRLSKTESSWQEFNATCMQHIVKFQREHNYYQNSDNLKVCQIKDCSIIEEYFCQSEIAIQEIIETITPIFELNLQETDASSYNIKVLSDGDEDTCQNLDCSQRSDYDCKVAKTQCEQNNQCQMELTFPYGQAFQGNCIPQKNYILSHWCSLRENKVFICSNTFAKALCLELSQNCYFDLDQGGCKQIQGNEHNIFECGQIANNCYASSSQKAICQNGSDSIKPGNKCKTVQKQYKTCVPLTTYNSSFSCESILSSDLQPVLCAKANNDCRYDGTKCINTKPTQDSNGKYLCDKSFSKSLCEKCGCNYTYLGYCQQTKQVPQLNEDGSNKWILCVQVNVLETTFKEEICGNVDQACAFVNDSCQDATHYSCNDLLLYTVSLKACQRCQDYPTKYIDNQRKCYKITDTIQSSCNNLNKYACLRNTKGVLCKWENFHCQELQIQNNSKIDCTILNVDACYTKQMNICWIDPVSSLCIQFDPYKGQCDQLKTESLCLRSMVTNCKWASFKCSQDNTSIISINTCNNLNQYLCLYSNNIACGWSDIYEKCYNLEFQQNPSSCNNFLTNGQQSFINRFNSYTCTQIQAQQGCIHDIQNICREIIPTDNISCQVSSMLNINEYACAKLAKGKCKFINSKCEKTEESKLGCLSYLNQEACLYQDAACKFDIFCQPYIIKSLENIRTLFPYTQGVCKPVELTIKSTDGNLDIGIALIYSVAQQKCLDITFKNLKINDCTYVGMNKYSCLLKTSQYCEFINGSCRKMELKEIQVLKTCKPTLNQYSCVRLNVACKFMLGQCIPLDDNDNCIYLSQNKSIVNYRACLRDRDTPCMFNYSTQNCEVITTPQKCPGLNYKGCLFITQGYNCEFKNSKCITSFGNLQCTDDINEDKCLSLITKGQYCYFDKKIGCRNIDTTKVDLSICYKDELQTNPFTCSRSTDVPCFFDKQNKKCIPYTEKTQSSYQQNYVLSNIYSFNQMTCEIFNDLKALMWQETCQVVKSSQLVYLKCSASLNKIACLSIKTPFQFCQYQNNRCVNANLEEFKYQKCDQIKDINSGAFCSLNALTPPCQYNKSLFKCELIETQIISCVEKDPEEKGLNKTGCEIDKTNCIFDENCYRLNHTGYQFCKDIKNDSKFQCKQVTNEGCLIESNQCKKIYYQSYSIIKCEQAVNRHGCVNIQTQNQYCQFDGEQCKPQVVKQFSEMSCLSIVNINHYQFCEQAMDIPCTFDLKNNACRNVYPQEEFSCERGLNKIACLTQTSKSLLCSFLDYCYGPNNGILNCTFKDAERCCREADQKDTCLNQKIYECEWTVDGCQSLQNRITECDKIINASFLVCASIKNTLCVYISSEYKCQTQQPTTCGYSQSSQQCKRMKSVSCIWDMKEDKCQYSEESAYLGCQFVTESSGNQRSCMNVEVHNQMCIYKDEECLLFIQQENVNNCLDTINKNACLQQTISDCLWNEQVYRVKKYFYQDEEDVVQGHCIPITNIDQIQCSKNISYTACLKVRKPGQHCIWKDFQCQSITDNLPNQLAQINQNACSLVSNGNKVRYEQSINGCVIIENINELTCKPEILGINKEACLAIKNQPCSWNTIQKKCYYIDIFNTNDHCERSYWTSISCTKIDINQPCGYSNQGCQLVDINTINCTHPGLNKYACLNISNFPCIWKINNQTNNYYCDDYFPVTSCLLVPKDVNPKVCQLVYQDACYFDIKNKKCDIPNLTEATCDTMSLNIFGCIQIDECVFTGFCQKVQNQHYDCNQYPIANYKVCQNAQDSCKFNELTFGCSQATEELCEIKGLSQSGCQQQINCYFKYNQCLCSNVIDQNCNQIENHKICNSFDHCIVKQNNQCDWKQCEDLPYDNCNGFQFNHSYCYLNNVEQCKSAKSCQDIKQPLYSCPTINLQPCILNSNLNQCDSLNCELLDEENCSKYVQYCKFEKSCKFLQCIDMKQSTCSSKNCFWNTKENICEEQIECSKIQDQDLCQQMYYQNNKCYWTQFNEHSICTDVPCRYLSTQPVCSGVLYDNYICVQISDETCVSCEEISSLCICLTYDNFCKYNYDKMKCESQICHNFGQEKDCISKNYCRFIKDCFQSCDYTSIPEDCQKQEYCVWKEGKCITKQQEINITDIEHPVLGEDSIKVTLFGLIVFYF
ncbi:unnamed protein product [Paramecium sonneborni]|uniref:Uncharacterized protein n=1 Tax=Paramecium sonneborni TaxID=65129 RepID=A0A8S1LDT7_9CILI|nr:unnamed protein product [Paramecium sonneborni]